MTCGDVSHGKPTLLWSITGGKLVNIHKKVIHVCPKPQCYFTTHSDISIKKVHVNIVSEIILFIICAQYY